MKNCCRRIKDNEKRRKAKWEPESSGLVLRIGHRASSNYYRVSETDQRLIFELERKKQLLNPFQKLLIDN